MNLRDPSIHKKRKIMCAIVFKLSSINVYLIRSCNSALKEERKISFLTTHAYYIVAQFFFNF